MKNLFLTQGILTKEQQAFGFELHEDEDFVTLMQGDERLRVFSARTVTIAEIRHGADQVIQKSKSGISFEKEIR